MASLRHISKEEEEHMEKDMSYSLFLVKSKDCHLRYLGATTRIEKLIKGEYRGSGLRWSTHLQECPHTHYSAILNMTVDWKEHKRKALEYSKFFNVVEDPYFLNIKNELGVPEIVDKDIKSFYRSLGIEDKWLLEKDEIRGRYSGDIYDKCEKVDEYQKIIDETLIYDGEKEYYNQRLLDEVLKISPPLCFEYGIISANEKLNELIRANEFLRMTTGEYKDMRRDHKEFYINKIRVKIDAEEDFANRLQENGGASVLRKIAIIEKEWEKSKCSSRQQQRINILKHEIKQERSRRQKQLGGRYDR